MNALAQKINPDIIKSQEQGLIVALRQKAGLPEKKLGIRIVYDHHIATAPDEVQVTGVKQVRGFTYLNLNGGDSWGYYHPTGNAKIIYNFKGEPNYLTRELLPDYYPDAARRAKQFKKEEKTKRKHEYVNEQSLYYQHGMQVGEKIYLAFRDRKTDQYYVGYHDPAEQHNEFHPVASKDRAAEYLIQHDKPKPELIETWDYQFIPSRNVVFDPQNRFINLFEPSKYMLNAKVCRGATVPPTIMHMISSALGGDKQLIEHFLNWIAVIFQLKIRTQTTWVLQGTTGTGKGLLFNKILQPLIGHEYCRSITLPNLEDNFNKFMGHCLLLFIDEVDTDQVRDMPKLMARLKNMITEARIQLRAMRIDLREVPNHLNLIMASNQPNSMRIEENDRRFNVCPRQEQRLLKNGKGGEKLVAKIHEELPDFANYLVSRTADPERARTTLETDAKRELQTITQTAIEEVAEALREGNLQYFIVHAPTGESNFEDRITFGGESVNLVDEYRVIIRCAHDIYLSGKSHVLNHRELFVLFEVLVGKMPHTKARLKKRLGHCHIQIKPHSYKGTSARGFRIQWQGDKAQLEEARKQLDSAPIPEPF
ncbi:MAG: primase-helicase family protein [Sedimenticola sp.]